MTTQTVSGRRYFTKAWLMEQKSLIALLVLIAIVSTLSPNLKRHKARKRFAMLRE